jgi:hypothetical protein
MMIDIGDIDFNSSRLSSILAALEDSMKFLTFAVATILVTGSAFGAERDVTEKAAAPACYRDRMDVLKAATASVDAAAQADCQGAAHLKDLIVGSDAPCDGVSITAIFSCSE